MTVRSDPNVIRWLLFTGLQGFLFFGGVSCLDPVIYSSNGSQTPTTTPATQRVATTMVPHLNAAIEPNRNLVWCGTFQLAWNECIKLTGGPLRFEPEIPLDAELNKQEFTRQWIDEANCVAIADFVRHDVYGQIDRALSKKTSRTDFKKYKPRRDLALRPQDIVAYSYLQADLKFPSPFERLDDHLTFEGTKVLAFGIGPGQKSGQEQLYPQLWVHDYNDRNDFVVELASKLKGHRLILARVAPAQTLLGTIQVVEKRLVTPPAVRSWNKLTDEQKELVGRHIGTVGDVLMVPKIGFEQTEVCSELCGRRLHPVDRRIAQDLILVSAGQHILFEMNEKGVKLRSTAHMSFGCGLAALPRGRWMAFDGPFLVMLQRDNAPLPYFAAWVGNTELLQK